MRQRVPPAKRDQPPPATGRKNGWRPDAQPRVSTVRQVALRRFLQRSLAVFLVVVAHAFLLNVPHPPSPALGVVYAASALCLAIAAWRLWLPTMQ
jgi:hypothetical protein